MRIAILLAVAFLLSACAQNAPPDSVIQTAIAETAQAQPGTAPALTGTPVAVPTLTIQPARTYENIATFLTVASSVVLAILAIWGEWVRSAVAGPKLSLNLRDEEGNLTSRNDGRKVVYYHIVVRNKRSWSPAKNVRILLEGIEKRTEDGEYNAVPLVAPLQLTWGNPTFHELLPTISKTEDTCDLGYLIKNSDRFTISLYSEPNDFKGYVKAGESMRVE